MQPDSELAEEEARAADEQQLQQDEEEEEEEVRHAAATQPTQQPQQQQKGRTQTQPQPQQQQKGQPQPQPRPQQPPTRKGKAQEVVGARIDESEDEEERAEIALELALTFKSEREGPMGAPAAVVEPRELFPWQVRGAAGLPCACERLCGSALAVHAAKASLCSLMPGCPCSTGDPLTASSVHHTCATEHISACGGPCGGAAAAPHAAAKGGAAAVAPPKRHPRAWGASLQLAGQCKRDRAAVAGEHFLLRRPNHHAQKEHVATLHGTMSHRKSGAGGNVLRSTPTNPCLAV